MTTSREEIASTCGWLTGPELQRFVATLAKLHAELEGVCRRLMSEGSASPLAAIQADLGIAANCARSLEQYIRTLMVVGQLPCRPDGDLPPLKRYRARLGAGLRGARSKAARGAGRARRLLAPVAISRDDLLPAKSLQLMDAATGTWRLTKDRGAWIAPIRIAPGVCRFRLSMRFGANATVRVRLDHGGEWSNAPAIVLAESGRNCEVDRYVSIPHHAAALQLEIDGAPGEVVVERCVIEQAPRWMNAGLSVARKAWAAWKRGDLANFAKRGAGMVFAPRLPPPGWTVAGGVDRSRPRGGTGRRQNVVRPVCRPHPVDGRGSRTPASRNAVMVHPPRIFPVDLAGVGHAADGS